VNCKIKLKIVLITYPEFFSGETEIINALFNKGLETLHVRKPELPDNKVKTFIQDIHPEYHSRIVLHGNYNLKNEFPVKGLHFSRSTILYSGVEKSFGLSLSYSAHSTGEIQKYADTFDYIFLSPVFDSISKDGYTSAFQLGELKIFFEDYNGKAGILALGGINSARITDIKDVGFHGVALLGAIWNSRNSGKAIDEFVKVSELWEVKV